MTTGLPVSRLLVVQWSLCFSTGSHPQGQGPSPWPIDQWWFVAYRVFQDL